MDVLVWCCFTIPWQNMSAYLQILQGIGGLRVLSELSLLGSGIYQHIWKAQGQVSLQSSLWGQTNCPSWIPTISDEINSLHSLKSSWKRHITPGYAPGVAGSGQDYMGRCVFLEKGVGRRLVGEGDWWLGHYWSILGGSASSRLVTMFLHIQKSKWGACGGV